MLAPNLKYGSECLSDIYNNVLECDNVSLVCSSTFIGKLVGEPQWISNLRTRLDKLKKTSEEWKQIRPEIMEKVMSPFLSFSNSFEALSDNIDKLNSSEMIEVFVSLKKQADKAEKDTIDQKQKFSEWLSEFNSEMKLIDESIEEGWSSIDNEEEKAAELIKSICSLQSELLNIEDDITPSMLESNASIYKTTISMVFDIALDASSMPYLSFLSLLITEGKMAFDILKNQSEVEALIDKIAEEQIELSNNAQALAESKALIKFLYYICEEIAAIDNDFSDCSNIWNNEVESITSVINSLNYGVDPKSILDINSIKASAEIWKELKNIAYKSTIGPDEGTPFEIKVGNE